MPIFYTFIADINDVEDVMTEWHDFVAEQREHDLVAIIKEEKLKEAETRKFLDNLQLAKSNGRICGANRTRCEASGLM